MLIGVQDSRADTLQHLETNDVGTVTLYNFTLLPLWVLDGERQG